MLDLLLDEAANTSPLLGLIPLVILFLAAWAINVLAPAVCPIRLQDEELTYRMYGIMCRRIRYDQIEDVFLARFFDVFWPPKNLRPMKVCMSRLFARWVVVVILSSGHGLKSVVLVVPRPRRMLESLQEKRAALVRL